MTTKLVSMNLGVRLELIVDGKPQLVEWSAVCPSTSNPQPYDILYHLDQWLEEQFDTDFNNSHVEIVKPKRIKATRYISHDTFNERIKALGYDNEKNITNSK